MAIDAVMLTDAELDHITGLLSLRETNPSARLHPARLRVGIRGESDLRGLHSAEKFRMRTVEDRKAETIGGGLSIEAVFVERQSADLR